MSYAVETKKRKFHRVLESLSKPMTGDAATKSPNLAASTARNRPAPDLSIKKVRLSSGEDLALTSRRDSFLKITRPSSRDSSASTTLRPTFVPWDRERFLERLETFRRVDRWSPKPSPINEVQWAKRGWICTDLMRVTCVGGCGGSVVVKLPDEIDELDGYDSEKVQERKEVRAKLVEEYSHFLAEGHGENCPWRSRGCDVTIHRLPLTNPDVAVSNLQKRYANLVAMGDKLPGEDIIQTPEGFDLEETLKSLPESFQQSAEHPQTESPQTKRQAEPETNPPAERPESGSESTQPAGKDHTKSALPLPTEPSINRAAITLALFGWDTVSDGTAGLVGCGACFRRLGLWLYKPKENGDITVYNTLEVANEHMEYCPWINGHAQSGTGKPTEKRVDLRSGWELLAQAVRVKRRRQIRSTASMDTLRSRVETSPADVPAVDEETKKATDREWWAKIRRMRQVLNVKAPKARKSIGP